MSKIEKFYRTFGYITMRTDYSAGHSETAEHPQDRQWLNFFTKGGYRNCITDETSTPPLYDPGESVAGNWYTPNDLGKEYYGNLYFECPEETTLWCLVEENNRGYLPPAEPWILNAGESSVLEVGTRIFFCEGNISIDPPMKLSKNKEMLYSEVDSPTEIHIKESSVTVTAVENSYGIKFL